MRYEVRCTNRECHLHETPYGSNDLPIAEVLAAAHAQRLIDSSPAHVVTVTDLDQVPTSQKTEAATGDKGGGHA